MNYYAIRIDSFKNVINIIEQHNIPHMSIKGSYYSRAHILSDVFWCITEENAPFAILCGLIVYPIKFFNIESIKYNTFLMDEE